MRRLQATKGLHEVTRQLDRNSCPKALPSRHDVHDPQQAFNDGYIGKQDIGWFTWNVLEPSTGPTIPWLHRLKLHVKQGKCAQGRAKPHSVFGLGQFKSTHFATSPPPLRCIHLYPLFLRFLRDRCDNLQNLQRTWRARPCSCISSNFTHVFKTAD